MSHDTVNNGFAIGSGLSPAEFSDAVMEKVYRNVLVDGNGCWIWQKSRMRNGYGQTMVGGKSWRVHRLVLTLTVRPLAADELACHTCNVKACCNPDHLYIGCKHVNAVDKVESGTNHYTTKTHCPRGHSYAEHGYLHAGSRNGRTWRSCRLCARISQRLRAGWPKELAETMDKTPAGHRPVNAKFKDARS